MLPSRDDSGANQPGRRDGTDTESAELETSQNETMQERFFILGCQRSGTTLLRLILEVHPDVFCYDELKGYAVLQGAIQEDLPHARLIGFKIPRWTEQMNCEVLV